MASIKTFMAIASAAGALAFAGTAAADTPVDPATPPVLDEGAPLPGGDPDPDQVKMIAAAVLAGAR